MASSRPSAHTPDTRRPNSSPARPAQPATEDTVVNAGNTTVGAPVGSDRAEVPVPAVAGS